MSKSVNEIDTYFGKCKCCTGYGYLKPMWREHAWKGQTEVYGDMFLECFDISWNMDAQEDQICPECIDKLRGACQFKKQVIEALETMVTNEFKITQSPDDNTEYSIKVDSQCSELSEFSDGDIEYLEEDLLQEDESQQSGTIDDGDDENLYTQVKRKRRSQKSLQATDSDNDTPKKWPKKLPPRERFKTYKQYTTEEFQQCLEAVKNNIMSQKEAANYYNIPLKTVASKIRAGILDKEVTMTRTTKFIEEIKTILKYTNATPFKSRFNNYYCGFCPPGINPYEDPVELRKHILKHKDRLKKVEFFLRPYYYNEMLKLDINNLKCTTCHIDISDWRELFIHLKDTHNEEFELAAQFVVPFNLDTEIRCVLCNNYFTAFMNLDSHMNAHYDNFQCDFCGETYITSNRLKMHSKLHEDSGQYTCDVCGKMFTLERYLKKHKLIKHGDKLMYKCSYCKECFKTEKYKYDHMYANHREKVRQVTCETCNEVFMSAKLYQRHLKNTHMKEHACEECGKLFSSLIKLAEHQLRHKGIKEFECHICKKRYYTKSGVKLHLRLHLCQNKGKKQTIKEE